jgi:hypothetical protein
VKCFFILLFQLVLSLCVASVLASDGWDSGLGGGGFHGIQQVHGGIKAPAFILPIPEIGLSLDKIPIFLPIPTIIFRKRQTLISKPIALNLGNIGFGGGHGGGMKFGGHGW